MKAQFAKGQKVNYLGNQAIIKSLMQSYLTNKILYRISYIKNGVTYSAQGVSENTLNS